MSRGEMMKSLQVVTPHVDCIYNCPFCIAKGHKHNNKFINNYKNNYGMWKNNLIQVINEIYLNIKKYQF